MSRLLLIAALLSPLTGCGAESYRRVRASEIKDLQDEIDAQQITTALLGDKLRKCEERVDALAKWAKKAEEFENFLLRRIDTEADAVKQHAELISDDNVTLKDAVKRLAKLEDQAKECSP